MKAHKKNHLQKIILIGSIFLLIGSSVFGTFDISTQSTSTGNWYSWQIQNVQADDDDEDEKEEDDEDDEEHESKRIKKGSSSDDFIPESEIQELLNSVFDPTPVSTSSTQTNTLPTKSNVSTPQTVTSQKSTSGKAVSGARKEVSSSNSQAKTVSKKFDAYSHIFLSNGQIYSLNYDRENRVFSFGDNTQEFTSKAELIHFIISHDIPGDGEIHDIRIENSDLAKAVATAEAQVTALGAKNKGRLYIERPVFTPEMLQKKQIQEEKKEEVKVVTPVVQPTKVPTPKPKTPVSAPTKTQTPVSTPKPTTPVTPTKQKDTCVNGDYTGNLYDGKCGTKPKDSCPNGDYTGNLYDGVCGTKPKDSCPNGDYTGNLYDGICGTKPKDRCVKDYSGNLYDGTCGTKPKPDTSTRAS